MLARTPDSKAQAGLAPASSIWVKRWRLRAFSWAMTLWVWALFQNLSGLLARPCTALLDSPANSNSLDSCFLQRMQTSNVTLCSMEVCRCRAYTQSTRG